LTRYTRKEFLSTTAVATARLIPAGVSLAATPTSLPSRLTICYYGWDWITSATPGEAYHDLDRTLRETKERGYNTVRAEAGLNWMFDLSGKRRGKLHFLDWIPGFSSNLHCVDAKGGGVHDVFERVIRLFELAAKYDMYVIPTSWEYQDAVAHLADSNLRTQILAVPYSERLMLLARQYDRLLVELKKRGLHKRIVQVEVINELNSPPLVCAPPGTPPQTQEEWVSAKFPRCPTDQVRALAREAVAFLRERHGDLLITVDGLTPEHSLRPLFPDNAQVVDHHVYVDSVIQDFWRAAGISGLRPGDVPDPEKNPFLRSMLKPDPKSWIELSKQATRVRRTWWAIAWLYENLDNNKFDEWCQANYSKCRQRVKNSIEKQFQAAGSFAKERNLPLVVDEGFMLYPPLHSRFVTTPEARWGEERGVNKAIETGHWGTMISGYFRPNTPVWNDADQCDWIRGLNRRIAASKQ
jgi:hypothetical protein